MNTQQLTSGWRLGSLCKRGHNYRKTGKSLRNTTGHCRACANLSSRRHYQKPDKKKKHFEKCRKWMRMDRKRNPLKHLVQSAKSRAIKRGLLFDIDADYMASLLEEQESKCHWLGIPISLTEDRFRLNKATLERVDPSGGYVKGNVVWASHFANIGRMNSSEEEFLAFLSKVFKTNSE